MCGIAGYTGTERPELITMMMADNASRGPDGTGAYSQNGVHFGHTRLKIIDIELGDQPMVRVDGRYCVCYNGEIYNYHELRREIEERGYCFKTTCDTELIPLGFAAFGEEIFQRLEGMFAFALHDKKAGDVFLVRDHLGIKPLYFANVGRDIVFSSTARAIARHPEIDCGLNPTAIGEFLQYRYLKSESHFFNGIKTVPPGTALKWNDGTLSENRFWTPGKRAVNGSENRDQITERVRSRIADSVKAQLRSDVPVGIFLSGGVDSTLVAHHAARYSSDPLSAFTFGIGDLADEVDDAKTVADLYGMRHSAVGLKSEDFQTYSKIVAGMDSPVADPIILPTYKLCQEAAKTVKVVLSGEGADEIFGGYVQFPTLTRFGSLSSTAPFLSNLAPLIRRVPIAVLNRFFDYQASLGNLGRKRVADLVGAIGDTGKLFALSNQIIDDQELRRGSTLPVIENQEPTDLTLSGLMHDFTQSWLPNQILHKMDQLSMAHGLEVRVPYVDHHLYDLLLNVPDELFINGGENKVLLRAAARTEGLASAGKRKIAFHLPVEKMWPTEFEALCKEWLSESVTRKFGIIRQKFADDCLREFTQGEFLASKKLFAMVALHMWLEENTQ
jgi:asparagine synthase (glutamine-hydrolysing)